MASPIKTPTRPITHLGSNGHGKAQFPGDERTPSGFPARRNSIFPLLVDCGVVLAMFGLIILRPIYSQLVGDIAIGAGVMLAIVALIGWIREARAEYSRMRD